MAVAKDIVDTVRCFFSDPNLSQVAAGTDSHRGPLCVAVSGGVDSMVLLHALNTMAAATGVRVAAVHVNHHVRQDADQDQQLVEDACAAWGVPCHVQHVQAATVPARDRRGLEADLRGLRFGAIRAVANARGSNWVCLAHHADDQLETVLWRLLRGTGGSGIGGIRPVQSWSGIHWLRPLLEVDKAALYAYAQEHGVVFAQDSTNQSDRQTRNALRLHVIPALKQILPQVTRTVRTFSRIVQEEDTWMDQQARMLLKSSAVWNRLWATIELTAFREAPLPLQRRAIQILLYYLGSDQISFAQVEQVLHAAFSETPSYQFALPDNCFARREYNLLWLERRPSKRGLVDPPYTLTWLLSAASVLNLTRTPPAWSWRFTCEPWRIGDGVKSASQFELRIPQSSEVAVRSALPGDRIRLLQGGHKKLQDVFVDAKVPRHLRGQWPLIWQGGEIVWIPGLRRSGAQLIEAGAHDGLVIRAYPYSTTDGLRLQEV